VLNDGWAAVLRPTLGALIEGARARDQGALAAIERVWFCYRRKEITLLNVYSLNLLYGHSHNRAVSRGPTVGHPVACV